jgi:EAL domain-containing protein (putative c-di-GMP-specific phosphodiesterase class I)
VTPELALHHGLIPALQRGEFVLHYQPVLDLHSGDVAAVEALIRWQHPRLGLLPPRKFIPAAESTGQIIAVGEWALEQACLQACVWRRAGITVRIAVNLSARQFSAPDLVGCVDRILRKTGLAGEMLELELTESMFADPDSSTAILECLRGLGVRVAIDDFGTGFSSLSYLTRFPLDTIKIDRSFIEQAAHDRHAATVVGFVIAMAHELDLKTVAEGVETAEQEQLLVTHGCDMLQGFLHSPPLPASECERWMRQRTSRQLVSIPGGANSSKSGSATHQPVRRRARDRDARSGAKRAQGAYS